MRFGTSYYPEFIDEDQWRRDLQNMREAALSLVRIGEFMWTAIEPREGVYAFEWLDRFVAMAHELGFQIIMGTPTATPPPWMTTQYPQILIERRDGTHHYPGGRRDVDVDNEIFRYFAAQIATELGQRYGHHPAVIGWQIDNELLGPEGEPPESHSIATTFRFRQHLKRLHGDISTMNNRWGTRFWSQEYSDWGEVGTPRNPRSTLGHVLDYSRFFSDSQKGFLKIQYDALRAVIDARQWVGHNSTAVFGRGHDHADWARSLDVAGWDAYPGAAGGGANAMASTAMAHDLFRSAKQQPIWIFETTPVREGITPAFFAEMRARGAEAVVMWHWREHRANAEYESNAFCDWAGRPEPRRVEFMRNLAARPELQLPLPTKYARQKAALLYCRDCERIYLTPDPYMKRGLDRMMGYGAVVMETYRVLRHRGVVVDLVHPGQSLEGYDLLVTPSTRVMSRAVGDQIRRFVERGGTLLSVAKMAHLDPWASFYANPGAPLEDVLGCTISRNVRIMDSEAGPDVRMPDGRTFSCLPQVDRVTPTTAEVLGSFIGDPVDGSPAALRNRLGKGLSFYAAGCSPQLINHLLQLAAPAAGIELMDAPEHVVVLPDLCGDGAWVFNYGGEPATYRGQTIEAGNFAHVA